MELNLYNFEDEQFSDSKYVLTSPRSLQACNLLDIKPAELLYKPLSDFQDEWLPSGVPLREIYDKYDLHETQRQRKLRDCREYREQMIRDKLYSMMCTPPNHVVASSQFDRGPRSMHNAQFPIEQTSIDDHVNGIFNASGSASLQRFRTSQTLLDSSKPTANSLTRTVTLNPTRSVSFLDKASQRSRSMSQEKTVRKSSSTKHRRRTRSGSPRAATAKTAWTNRSYRCDGSDPALSQHLSKSLHLDSLTSWRSPDMRATYIQDSELRRTLGYRNSTGPITPRDEKILEAMNTKNQREEQEEMTRSLAQFQWEEQRISYEHEKDMAEVRRRQLLALRLAEAEEAQAAMKQRQQLDDEELRRSLLYKCAEKDVKWRNGAERQQTKHELELRQKRRRSLDRKRSQERMLGEFERQRNAVMTEHLANSKLNMERAAMKKNNMDIFDNMRMKRRNEEEAELHRRRYEEVQRNDNQQTEDLRISIAQKEALSRLNQSHVHASRDYALHINAKEQLKKMNRCKQNLEKLEEEKSQWQRALHHRRTVLEAKAKLTAAQIIELKSLRVQAEREERQSKQRQAYSRILAEEELARRDQKDAIAMKDTKIKAVQHHKDQVISEVRSLAATSQQLREELKKKYGKDSFDKKALETELQNRVGRGPLTAYKNKSSVLIA